MSVLHTAVETGYAEDSMESRGDGGGDGESRVMQDAEEGKDCDLSTVMHQIYLQ